MLILPSLLSIPFLKMKEALDTFKDLGITHLHIDVMDGHFVPNLSFCPRFVKEIHEAYPHFFLDVHIMGTSSIFPFFKESPASRITIHPEAGVDPYAMLSLIKSWKKEAGIALNPATPWTDLLNDVADTVLVMGVSPGFGGQKFIESTRQKIKTISHKRVYLDGGMNEKTLSLLKDFALEGVVVGNALMKDGTDFNVLRKNYQALQASLGSEDISI